MTDTIPRPLWPRIDGHMIVDTEHREDHTWAVWCSCEDWITPGVGNDLDEAVVDYADRHLRKNATTVSDRLVIDSTLAIIPTEDWGDPDARVPDAPAFRHVILVESLPSHRTAYLAPHLPGMHPVEECLAVATAWETFLEGDTWPADGRWYVSVDEHGLLEVGGRSLP